MSLSRGARVLTARRLITGVGTIEFPVVRIDASGVIAEIESDPSVRSGGDALGGAVRCAHAWRGGA